jgi:glycosyltransferase involved in cell wall biosynthesis
VGYSGAAKVKVAAIVGVKDECDLIQPCLERLWAVGVEPILVLDDHSVDGTCDVVDRLASRSPAPLARTTFSPDFGQNMLVDGPVVGPFVRQHSPDWLLFIDSDEFLICINDDLPAALEGAVSPVLSIERFNVPLTNDPFVPVTGTDGGAFLGVPLITGREVLNRKLLEESVDRRWIMNQIGPKLACRPECVAQYGLGWHSVLDASGQQIPAHPAKGIVIVHLPMTTLDRFVRKVGNAREFFRNYGESYPGGAAWHWKWWVDLADRGLLDVEFEAQRMGESEMNHLIDLGAIERADAVLKKSARTSADH